MAARIERALGILDHFDDIFDIVAADYVPKPAGETYDKFVALNRVDTNRAAMFEDDPRNLAAPHAMGMRTVHVAPEPAPADHIHHHTDDLAAFLARLA